MKITIEDAPPIASATCGHQCSAACATPPAETEPPVIAEAPPNAYLALSAAANQKTIDSARDVYDLLVPALGNAKQEDFLVVCLDVHGRLLKDGIAQVARGQRTTVALGIEDIEREVILRNPDSFIVVHVHPSGRVVPSPDDLELTKTIEEGFSKKTDAVMIDHVIIAGQGGGAYHSIVGKKSYKVRTKKAKK